MAYQAIFWLYSVSLSSHFVCGNLHTSDIATSWSTGVSTNDNKVNLGTKIVFLPQESINV